MQFFWSFIQPWKNSSQMKSVLLIINSTAQYFVQQPELDNGILLSAILGDTIIKSMGPIYCTCSICFTKQTATECGKIQIIYLELT